MRKSEKVAWIGMFAVMAVVFWTVGSVPSRVRAAEAEQRFDMTIREFPGVNVDCSLPLGKWAGICECRLSEEASSLEAKKGVATRVDMAVFSFSKKLPFSEVAKAMEMKGYRPANVQELLGFVSHHTKVKNKPVIALGSTFRWDKEFGYTYYPYVDLRLERRVHVAPEEVEEIDWEFLAVKK